MTARYGLSKGGKPGDNYSRFFGARDVFRYTHMPQILPRIRALGGKFGNFSFLLALIYRSARLLPPGHPLLNPASLGRYGIREVIATAANNLVMKRENIDQILIFGAVLLALIMIVVQLALIAFSAFSGLAYAADTSAFNVANADSDLISQFMRQVFGVQDIFGNNNLIPQPGLHAILGFYSNGMMIIAVLIVLYYVITIIGESAQSGTPFGRRFNGLWAPIRLVLALGLLVPLGDGLNAAQYLTLHIAKFGSGFATQGWIRYTEKFDNSDATLSKIDAPSIQTMGGAVFAAEACRVAYNQIHLGTARPVIVLADDGLRAQLATFSNSDIAFAQADGAKQLSYVWATHKPSSKRRPDNSICGMITMQIVTSGGSTGTASSTPAADVLIAQMQYQYVSALGQLVNGISGSIVSPMPGSLSDEFAKKTISTNGDSWIKDSAVDVDTIAQGLASVFDQGQSALNAAAAGISWDKSTQDNLVTQMKKDAIQRGWGTAGAYYLEMSKMSQVMYDAVGRTYPVPVQGPDGLSAGIKTQSWGAYLGEKVGITDSDRQLRAALGDIGTVVNHASSQQTVFSNNAEGQPQNPASSFTTLANAAPLSLMDPILWLARFLFGDAFMILIDKPTLNPMAALLHGGGDILDRTKTLAGWYVISQVGAVGGVLAGVIMGGAAGMGALSPGTAMVGGVVGLIISQIAGAFGGILWLFMIVGLTAGIVLFYLLPLMPFMYFFFSVVNWVVEVAESFIAMPLFALAHLRIDGEGLPGQTAYQGWLILFGILLRPIMIVAGLIVGSLVFNAGAFFLNLMYKYAVFAYNPDVTGTGGSLDFSKISGFGIVTYLIIYVYMIYMLANSSFKLIDQIPDKMMRWIGGPTPFTGDRPVDIGNMQSVALAGYAAVNQGRETTSGFVSGIQKMGEGVASLSKGKAEKPTRGPTTT
jgi:conjugal transfer/type IV secretion protein DotA/TraY